MGKINPKSLSEAAARIRKWHAIDDEGVCECRKGEVCEEGILLRVQDEMRSIIMDYLEEHRPECWDSKKNSLGIDVEPPVLTPECCSACKSAMRFLGLI